jgi:alpha(1,3/1,4) fucosyltransferase
MSVIRVTVVDEWFGNDDEAAIVEWCHGSVVCRKLAERGFELEPVCPSITGARADLAFFSPWGTGEAVKSYRDAVTVFWCFENHHYFSEFVGYRQYQQDYDFSFTFDPTAGTNFRITGAIFYGDLSRLGAPGSLADARHALSQKTDFACFLYSEGREDQNGVRLRNEFFRSLSRYRHINSGGAVMNNLGHQVPHAETGRFVSRHKFVISMENSITAGYVTEKIMHGFLHGSVPIYCGAPDVNLDYNEQAFIHYRGDNFEEIRSAIDRLDHDDEEYLEFLVRPKLATNRRPEFDPGALDTFVDAIAERLRLRDT